MNAIEKLKSAITTQKLARSVLSSEHTKLIGTKVRMNEEHAAWLKSHLDQLHTSPHKSRPEETQSYYFNKYLIKHRPAGKVIDSRFDTDGITLKIEFTGIVRGKEVTDVVNLCVENIEPG